MYQEYASLDGTTCCDSTCEFGTVGMSGIFINASDASSNLDFLALDTHSLRALFKEATECSLSLEPDQ